MWRVPSCYKLPAIPRLLSPPALTHSLSRGVRRPLSGNIGRMFSPHTRNCGNFYYAVLPACLSIVLVIQIILLMCSWSSRNCKLFWKTLINHSQEQHCWLMFPGPSNDGNIPPDTDHTQYNYCLMFCYQSHRYRSIFKLLYGVRAIKQLWRASPPKLY